MKTILTQRIIPARPSFYHDPPEEGGGGDGEGTITATRKDPIHISEAAKKHGQRFQKGGVKTKVEVGLEDAEGKALVNEKEPPAGGEPPEGEQPPEILPKKKPGSNVPKIIEEKRAAESERDEARKKIEIYEKTTVPELNGRIAELQKKIDSGELSAAKEQELQGKINNLEQAKADTETKLTKELEGARKRLSVLDLPNDPLYKQKYLVPLGQSVEAITSACGSDSQLKNVIHRAMMAQKAYLQAGSQEEANALADERDSILSTALEGVTNQVKQRRLDTAFSQFIEASEKQAAALADNEKTQLELRKESERAQQDSVKMTMQEWTREYESTGKDYDDDAKIPDDLAEKIKELGIVVDMEAENKYARKAITGELNRPEVVKLIHRGRVHTVMQAKIKALEAINAGQAETIAKLRGAGPGGGGPSGTPSARPKDAPPVNDEGQNRREWERKRFAPPDQRT